MTKDEVMKLALDALEKWDARGRLRVLAALKAALARPEQEPVAWVYEVNGAHTKLDLCKPPDDAYDEGTLYPLYTSPPQRQPEPEPYGWTDCAETDKGAMPLYEKPFGRRQPLTEDEIDDIWAGCSDPQQDSINMHEFAQAVQKAANNKKNA